MDRDDWYWAADRKAPAGDRFIIENGQPALWARVRAEIGADQQCAWMPIQRRDVGAQLEDVLDMLITVVLPYRVNYNRFAFEAAKMPVFARFLRGARSDLCNYVSNPMHLGALPAAAPEPYSDAALRRLGAAVNRTLGLEGEWWG